MPRYVFVCKQCGHEDEETYINWEEYQKALKELVCTECTTQGEFENQVKGCDFKLKGKWFKEGY